MIDNTLIQECQSLDCLFDLWKSAQSTDEDNENNPNSRVADNIFCPDGFLSKSQKQGPCPVLFICRESHVDDNASSDQEFWMQKVANDDDKSFYNSLHDRHAKSAYTKYNNCLDGLLEKYNAKYNKKCSLNNCSYMNINKRGGSSKCDINNLSAYADKYSEFIKREIKIIDPDKIIICGKLNDDIIKNIISDSQKTNYCVYERHPSVYTKSSIDKFNFNN